VGELSASSFEFYEGLRILLPGGFVLGLYAAISETFFASGLGTAGHAFAGVLAGVAVGFILFSVDVPSKAAVFFYDAPEAHMRSWRDVAPPEGTSHLNVYYEVLDVEVPPGLRNRVYYLGAIYRIGFESIYLAASSVPVLALAVLFPSVGNVRTETSNGALRSLFGVLLALNAAVLSSALWSRYRRYRRTQPVDRSCPRRASWKQVGGDLDREIPEFDRALLLIGVVLLVVNLSIGWRWAGVAGIALPGTLWAFRYCVGVRPSAGPVRAEPRRETGHSKHLWLNPWWWLADRSQRLMRYFTSTPTARRQNLHAVSAGALFCLTSVSLSLIGLRWAVSSSPLSSRVVVGWAAANLVTGILITLRAHERKLIGSYASQRTWLNRNKKDLVEKGYLIEKCGHS
jgi:hypothetical protein